MAGIQAGSAAELEAELQRVSAARNREDMAPTIAALLEVLQRHPDDARVLYEVAGAYDTAGEEETAAGFYEQAMALGLEGDVLRRCYLQYGSTLRILGRSAESMEVFARARQAFPASVSLGVFEALTLHAAGKVNAALAGVLVLLAENVSTEDLERYLPAVLGNAGYLASLDAGS